MLCLVLNQRENEYKKGCCVGMRMRNEKDTSSTIASNITYGSFSECYRFDCCYLYFLFLIHNLFHPRCLESLRVYTAYLLVQLEPF